ncbi:WD40 repeat domain-containing protein [Allokutzneria albata]|uniref:WD domain-containing protein, G-beta repeat-containing protein n=1 Tax=Allokutzneria albata TaxID=211114 RepID=A0A1G9V965_ALLAB|nr:hypothetical protein [Allokutzneria albata]SDM68724.1 WD domain-containing protein, G-beta repeat-containing protein [Allokutzneria albata]
MTGSLIDVLLVDEGKPVTGVVFSPNGHFLAAVAGRRLHLWDAIRRRPLVPARRPASNRKKRQGNRNGQPHHVVWVNCAAFSPDSSLVAVGGSYEFFDHERGILYDGNPVHVVTLVDVQSGTPVGDPFADADGLPFHGGHDEDITHVAFSPDGTLLTTSSEDGTTWLWDVATRQPRNAHDGEAQLSNDVTNTALSPDGSMMAEAGDNGTIRLWSTTR